MTFQFLYRTVESAAETGDGTFDTHVEEAETFQQATNQFLQWCEEFGMERIEAVDQDVKDSDQCMWYLDPAVIAPLELWE